MKQLLLNFLKNEDGFIGAILGGLAGKALGGLVGKSAIGGALGSAFGKNYDANKAQGRVNNFNQNRFVRLRQAAEAGGFHPLEALRAGGAISPGTSGPKIGSTAAMTQTFDQIESILTGDKAEEKRREEVKDNIERVQADTFRRSGSSVPIGSPSSMASTMGELFSEGEAEPLDANEAELRQPHGEGAPRARATIWNGGSITLVGPTGLVKFPKRYAEYFKVNDGDPFTMDLVEQMAGDEIGQAIYADVAANIGITARSKTDKTMSVAEVVNSARNWFSGKNTSSAGRKETRSTKPAPTTGTKPTSKGASRRKARTGK